VARNLEGLNETKQLISNVSPNIKVEPFVADLSSNDTSYVEKISEIFAQHVKSAQLVAILHNAGTLGNISLRSNQLNSADDWHQYLQTNLISTILLNNAIYSIVKGKVEQFVIVDITSLLALTPFPSFTQYSVGKAAREAFFRGFAHEHPDVRVLSYSPGPVQTNMRTVIANE
jgi:sepiapterin reductase